MNNESPEYHSQQYSDDGSRETYVYGNRGWSPIGSSPRTSLGCGSLIVIALIVLIFGASGNKRIETKVNRLQILVDEQNTMILNQTREIAKLESKIDDLSEEIRRLREP